MSDDYEIRSIIREATEKDGKENKGKFLVEWKPTFVHKKEINGEALAEFQKKGPSSAAEVLGPIDDGKIRPATEYKWAVKFEKRLESMNYKDVCENFPHLLIKYYESRICYTGETDDKENDVENTPRLPRKRHFHG